MFKTINDSSLLSFSWMLNFNVCCYSAIIQIQLPSFFFSLALFCAFENSLLLLQFWLSKFHPLVFFYSSLHLQNGKGGRKVGKNNSKWAICELAFLFLSFCFNPVSFNQFCFKSILFIVFPWCMLPCKISTEKLEGSFHWQ